MVKLRAPNSVDQVFMIALTALLGFAALFIFRSLDDNRLFNWQWVFAGDRASRTYVYLVAGIAAAYVLSRIPLVERRPRAFLFLFSYGAAALFWTEPELLVDASRYFTQAKHLSVYGTEYFLREWGRDIPAWTDLPAIPFLYGQIFRLFGEDRMFIQTVTTLLFSGTVLLTYLIGRTLWDEETGFYAGMLLLGMPYLITQVPLMLVDVPTMFFLTLAIFTFLMALERGGAGTTALASCALFLAVFSKYSTWPMLSVLVIIFLVFLKRNPGATLRRGASVILLAGLLAGAAVLLKFDVFSEQIRLLLNYQKPGLERWGESFVSTFLFQINPFITIAAGYSLIVAFKRRDPRYAIISWLVVLVFLFQIRRIRYILPVFPLIALMASYGLRTIEGRELKRLIAFVVVITSLVIAVFAYLPFALTISAENVKKTGEYLDALGTGPVEVVALPLKEPVINPSVAVPLLDLYTQRRIVYRYQPERFPPPKDVATSALRFTWEFKDPQYYQSDKTQINDATIVAIWGEVNGRRTPAGSFKKRIEGYHLLRRFDAASDPFQYKTIVEVYSKP
jgi:4-amino-4-deoxy-L-arabinose transferase-like glycosyltransferase